MNIIMGSIAICLYSISFVTGFIAIYRAVKDSKLWYSVYFSMGSSLLFIINFYIFIQHKSYLYYIALDVFLWNLAHILSAIGYLIVHIAVIHRGTDYVKKDN